MTHFPFFICGLATAMVMFFTWPSAPPLWSAVVLVAAALAMRVAYRFYQKALLLNLVIMLAAASFGFGWAQWRTHIAATHYAAPLFEQGQPLKFNGEIIWRETQSRSTKWDIRLTGEDGRPFMLRLYGRRHIGEAAWPGCHMRFTADIEAPSGPIIIGGYDPRRDDWFRGQRGQGFIRSIEEVTCPPRLALSHHLSRWRLHLAQNYRAAMTPEAGPVAAALVTGVRGAIEKPVREAFRHSGLAHMLAISGLHMALFAGSIYALLRLLAAAWPRLSLYYDTRKPSAMVSLFAATGYLLISGAGVATQRAYIMMAILFLAILLDRPAVTMRNVLWAMLLVLLWQPQAILQVGFQMSFAAVLALVAVYEIWQRRDGLYLRWDEMSLPQQILRRFWRYASALFLTSLIAGSVTGFLALVQFHRVGSFGLPTNLLAMPIFGTMIMPMAPLSLLLMPLGLEGPAMAIMNNGIHAVLAIATYFTGFERAVYMPGATPPFVLPIAAIGFIWGVLVSNRWRLLGLVPIIAMAFFIGQGERPALHMFGRDLIIVRDMSDGLVQLRRRGHAYELERIEAFHGGKAKAISCRPACRLRLSDNLTLAYHDRPQGLSASCREVDIIIMPFYEARYPCAAKLLDKPAFRTRAQRQYLVKDGKLEAQSAPSGRFWQN